MPLVLDSLRNAVKALSDLRAVAENVPRMEQFSQVERDGIRAGVIQNFKVTYELCWKLMARRLEANGACTTCERLPGCGQGGAGSAGPIKFDAQHPHTRHGLGVAHRRAQGLIACRSLPGELQRVVTDGGVTAAGFVQSVQSRPFHQVCPPGHEHEAERVRRLHMRYSGCGHGASLRRWQRAILAKRLAACSWGSTGVPQIEAEHSRWLWGQWARPHPWLVRPLLGITVHPAASSILIARRISFFGWMRLTMDDVYTHHKIYFLIFQAATRWAAHPVQSAS